MKNLTSTLAVDPEQKPSIGTIVPPPPAAPPPAAESNSNEKLYYALAGGIAGLVFGYLMAYQTPAGSSSGSAT